MRSPCVAGPHRDEELETGIARRVDRCKARPREAASFGARVEPLFRCAELVGAAERQRPEDFVLGSQRNDAVIPARVPARDDDFISRGGREVGTQRLGAGVALVCTGRGDHTVMRPEDANVVADPRNSLWCPGLRLDTRRRYGFAFDADLRVSTATNFGSPAELMQPDADGRAVEADRGVTRRGSRLRRDVSSIDLNCRRHRRHATADDRRAPERGRGRRAGRAR